MLFGLVFVFSLLSPNSFIEYFTQNGIFDVKSHVTCVSGIINTKFKISHVTKLDTKWNIKLYLFRKIQYIHIKYLCVVCRLFSAVDRIKVFIRFGASGSNCSHQDPSEVFLNEIVIKCSVVISMARKGLFRLRGEWRRWPKFKVTVGRKKRVKIAYSHLPNKQAGRNKWAGLHIFTKFNLREGFKIHIIKGN